MKSTQVVLQFFIMIVVFTARRIPSPAMTRSLVTSTIMIMFAITKALMSQQTSHTKKTSRLKQFKQLVWIICLAGTIFTSNSIILNQFVWGWLSYGKEYNRASPSLQKLTLIVLIASSTLISIVGIFFWKNWFNQHLQTRIKFIMLSILHAINCMTFVYNISIVFAEDIGSEGIVIPSIFVIILNSSLVIVFAKAAFSVSKLNDIWSLEKMTSKELCCIPNLLFSIVFLSFIPFIFLVVVYSFVGDPVYA